MATAFGIPRIRLVLLVLIPMALFMSALAVLINPNQASAYDCVFSGPNKDGKVGNAKLEYYNGSCVVWGPDKSDPSKKENKYDNFGNLTGFECKDGTVKQGNDCFTYAPRYTGIKPTYDNGSAVPVETWQSACSRAPSYYGSGSHYNESMHACEVDSMCSNVGAGIGPGGVVGGVNNTNVDMAGCRKIGNTVPKPEDVIADPTTARVKECTDAKLQWDVQKQDCKWTKEACEKKDGGQGVWIESSKECKAYSDLNKEDCIKEGGDFKIIEGGPEQGDTNNSQPDRWECVKKGTNGSEDVDPNAPAKDADCLRDGEGNCIEPGALGSVDGKCGEARTNIVSCDGEGATALGNVLRVFVIVLSIGVGIAAVGGIAYSAVQYAGASDNEGNVSAAKDRIRNIVIGLLVYGFMVVIVNWLVPGGVIVG